MQSAKEEISPTVPIEYSGKWIAWSADHMRIVSSSDSLHEARQKAFDLGENEPWMDKVPHRTIRFGGSAFRA
ncbi:MAG: hypothetical protein AAB649_04490 [Patescibacteria group bacterium]